MERTDLSLSFVGVWEKPLEVTPTFDNRFSKDLFGAPYDTFNGVTPDGYVIAIENKPFPMVVMNPLRLVVKASNVDNLQNYLQAVKQELEKKGGVRGGFSSFGINREIQWTGIEESSEAWMWRHFINPKLRDGNTAMCMCSKLDLRVGLTEMQVANVEIEPRRGIRNGIFVNINHHHNQPLQEIPVGEEVERLAMDSQKIIEENIVKKMIENGI